MSRHERGTKAKAVLTYPAMEKLNIEVTDRAKEKLKEALSGEDLAGHVVRLVALKTGAIRFRYQMGVEPGGEGREDDRAYEEDGITLRADPSSAENLEGVKLDFVDSAPGEAGFKFHNPLEEQGWDDPIAQRLQELLDNEVNPSIASHGGYIDLVDFKDKKAYVAMGGGCQGCGMARVTLREGVETRVRELIPEVEEIIDVTDHSAGQNPHHAPHS